MSYEDTDREALLAGDKAIDYIIDGTVTGLPLEFRGMKVFGVIRALRENDEILHGDASALTPPQQERLNEIESDIDTSVAKGLQYYPFGHKHNKQLDSEDKRKRELRGNLSSWGTQGRRTVGKRSAHAGQILTRRPND